LAVLGRVSGVVVALLVICGCGYRMASGDLREAGAIAIVTPRNDGREPGYERVVADALRRELLRRAGARLAEDPAKAGLVVSGRIVEVETAPRSFTSVVLALEYEARVSVELRARRGEEDVVGATRLSESERYLASADIEAQRKNREEALRRVASVLAARFLDQVGDQVTR
jgi:hypothetical protein